MSRRITIPRTALGVSPLCLGGNRLGAGLGRDESFALLDAFVAAGGNFVDTAHVYADWLPEIERSCSEKTLGRWRQTRGSGDGIVVATKIGHPDLSAPAAPRLDRDSLRLDVAEALDNLRTDRLDLVYLHRDDPAADVADILGVLEELCGEGRISHYAASNWSAGRLQAAAAAAERHGWQGFVANQPEWSLAARISGSAAADLLAMDAGMLAWHRLTGAAAIPYSSQARGFFDKLGAGKIDQTTARAYDSAANRSRGVRLAALAARYGVSPTEAMLALFRLAPFPVIPVVGCHTSDQIRSSFRGADLMLDPADAAPLLAELGQPSAA